jgi:hypothetical protein
MLPVDNPFPGFPEFARIEEIFDLNSIHPAEDAVIAQNIADHLLYRWRFPEKVGCHYDIRRLQTLFESRLER